MVRLLLAPGDHVHIEGRLDLIHAHRGDQGIEGQHSQQGQIVLLEFLLQLSLKQAMLPERHLQVTIPYHILVPHDDSMWDMILSPPQQRQNAPLRLLSCCEEAMLSGWSLQGGCMDAMQSMPTLRRAGNVRRGGLERLGKRGRLKDSGSPGGNSIKHIGMCSSSSHAALSYCCDMHEKMIPVPL